MRHQHLVDFMKIKFLYSEVISLDRKHVTNSIDDIIVSKPKSFAIGKIFLRWDRSSFSMLSRNVMNAFDVQLIFIWENLNWMKKLFFFLENAKELICN